uniref:unhealthy ribosome biogenesis protein 2 homolog n=1 Tax=Myxine glutinosa TaxID=7769 RepID=UPI00358DECE7
MASVCGETWFHFFLKETLMGLSWVSFLPETRQDLLVSIRMCKLLAQCQLDTVKGNAFLYAVPEAISALTIIMLHISSNSSSQQTMVLAVLETLAVLLRAIAGSLWNPHHVAQALQALQAVPLRNLLTREDHDVFHAYHEILHCILQLHPQVMLKASASFLCAIRHLLHSVMREGRQKADTNSYESDKDWVLRSAQSMERLYCQVAACAANFTALASFLVAEYVDELQKVTLRTDVKRHLSEGIFAVLDVCREADLNMLRTCLSPGVQEIFRHLYTDFQRFHQYKTRVRADTEDV